MTQLRIDSQGYVPTAGDTPWHRMGGTEAITALVEAFYDAMEQFEPALAAIHRVDDSGKISRQSRDAFAMFLTFWLGGPDDYLKVHGHPRLRMRHGRVLVDAASKDAWLRSMKVALDGRGIDGELRAYLDNRFSEVAEFLRNGPG